MDTNYKDFVQTIIDNVKRNGFPSKKVAFPIMKLYETAEKKDLNFNKALEYLDEIQIAHIKTPDRIIFYAKDRFPEFADTGQADGAEQTGGPPAEIDPSLLAGMDPSQLMATAAEMMQNMNPEQLNAARKMYENMSDDERAQLLEQAKKLGIL